MAVFSPVLRVQLWFVADNDFVAVTKIISVQPALLQSGLEMLMGKLRWTGKACFSQSFISYPT